MAKKRPKSTTSSWTAVDAALRSREILSVVCAFQSGIYDDMKALCAAMQRYGPREHPLYYCPDEICPLVDAIPTERMPALVACLPYMRNVLFYHAAQNGRLDLLQFLEATFDMAGVKFLVDFAAQNGHMTVLTYLDGKKMACTTIAMDSAAANGHLHVVQFLHERGKSCTRNAMDSAAANGHLEIVQFLDQHRDEGCTRQALNDAAERGHLEIVRYLHENRYEGDIAMALETATDAAVVAYLSQVMEEELGSD
ncbi:unnamed protein product [Aphanomyces euteiches]|uniref:Uncharacterized protein n=1 Tax=Aphanomyces euteiches TaxID=100861 RepID=A0A6G0WJ15_9STRA|nr:hypothetical protein Ae201684_014718 [Aphanomyces euteiches]KAH9078264.1 hypothetical protein Ae201684P_019355 [Aphanomyces euteiches]KAH9157968.1 hypothetical protein AeRB84_000206 [Aphanomyces euteiches]